jgi:putative phage-type endonuclease
MSFIIVNAEQRSPEWFAARLGRLTGSRAKDMLATIAKGEAAARRDYRTQLVTERLTGRLEEDGFTNAAMQRGIELEPQAFAAYEAKTGQMVQRSGFLAHDTYMAGCSLDGHVGDFEGIVELKCPKSATHLRYLKAKECPTEHLPQVMHNLWITGAEWCDFVSYDDRFPEPLQLVIVRVKRTDVDLTKYEAAAVQFLAEVEAEVKAVEALAA